MYRSCRRSVQIRREWLAGMKAHRGAAWKLTHEEANAARHGDWATVRARAVQVYGLDPELHSTVLVRDVAIAGLDCGAIRRRKSAEFDRAHVGAMSECSLFRIDTDRRA